ncbi:MAG: PEGA domain-containing protein [Acidobacteria bacterium]|nr:PEGA domain-containing protein [Acidobacteriota bacterium]
MPAKIYIDGHYSGPTPTTVRLTAGDHQVRLIADGYDEWTRRVKLKSRRQTAIMASMRRAPGQ